MRRSILSKDTCQTNGLGKYIITLLPIHKTHQHLRKKELYLIHHFPYFFDQNSLPFGNSNGRKDSLGKHCYTALFENVTSKQIYNIARSETVIINEKLTKTYVFK